MYQLILNEDEDFKVTRQEYLKKFLKFYVFLSYTLLFYKFVSRRYNYVNFLNLLKIGGPLFIKIGQNIANKNNIDPDLKSCLTDLQDKNFAKNNIDSHTLRETYFLDNLEEKPLASASIASIFKCVYKGKDCIIKATHKNIRKDAIISINIFEGLRHRISNFSFLNLFNQLVDLNQIYKELLDQTDLRNEVNNLNEISQNFKDKEFSDLIIFPKVYYYDENVIIESFEDGLELKDFVDKYPERKKEASHIVHCVFYKMFFDNCIHADMHFSNVRFKLENDKVKIVLYDFGLVSRIKEIEDYKVFINVYKKNMFVPDVMKFIGMIKKFNKNPGADLDNFEKECIKYDQDKQISYSLNKMHSGITSDENYTSTSVVIKKILEFAVENNLRINDYAFNICNGFILLDDYNIFISQLKSTLKERLDFANQNGFIDDMRINVNKIFSGKK